MSKSMLEEIYFCDSSMPENLDAGKEYHKIANEAFEYYEKLEKILNEEQKKWLDEIYLLSGGTESEWGFANFRIGFKLGMQLVLEGLEDRIFDRDKGKKGD